MDLFATHFGTYEVDRGRAGPSLVPFRHDPAPSAVGQAFLDLADHPDRILTPMVREGFQGANAGKRGEKRGQERFVPLPWNQALDLVAGEVARVRADHGNRAIFGGSYGWASAGRVHHAQSWLKRFLNLAGGFTGSRNTYSYGAAAVLLPHVLGRDLAETGAATPTWDRIAANARTVLAFGGFRLSNAQVQAGGAGAHRSGEWLRRAVAAGARIVAITPSPEDVPPGAEHLPIRPNSDTAMMLAMAHVIDSEGLADHDFLARCTTGSAPFLAYLRGETDGVAKSAAWAARLTGIDAATIRALALKVARTPSLVNVAWSLQRARHGEQPYWAAIALAAVAGQIGRDGCGFAFGLTAVGTIGMPVRALKGPAVPQGQNPVADFIPVARITELLERPGGTIAYDGATLNLPDIRLIYWAGGNPFHHHQDLDRLRRAWQRPETIIVHEPVWTASARMADIVLPVALPFERSDIAVSSRDNWIIASRQVQAPPADIPTDFAIFRALAGRLGFSAAFDDGRDPEAWAAHLYAGYRARYPELPDYAAFQAQGFAALDADEEAPAPSNPLADFVAAPEAHPLPTPSGRIELFSATVAGFGLPDCPGHPAWLEPEEWLGAPAAAHYPLHLVSPQPANRLHSQLEQAAPSRNARIAGCEPVLIAPEDAAARGIADGDRVLLFNDRGRCLAGARIQPGLMPGVVSLATGAAYAPDRQGIDRGGNPNVLTSILPTSGLSQGPAPNSCLVQIRLWKEE